LGTEIKISGFMPDIFVLVSGFEEVASYFVKIATTCTETVSFKSSLGLGQQVLTNVVS
jgi:hypothetical protein